MGAHAACAKGGAPTSAQVKEILDVATQLIERANATYQAVKLPCGSRALSFAVEAGLPPQMAYTAAETSRYTGVPLQTLYYERNAGRLAFVIPKGNSRGALIRVDEVDRWMEGNVDER